MADNSRTHEDAKLDLEIFECRACQIEPGHLRPGDSLEGRIYVSSESELSITSVQIRLQGFQVTFVTSGHERAAEYRSAVTFLDVQYPPSSQPIQGTGAPDTSCTYSFPFQFIIPEANEITNSGEQPLLCQLLPPSFHLKNAYFDRWSLIPRPQAAITYSLRALVSFKRRQGAQAGGTNTVAASKDIDFLPYTDIQPPTYVPSFPGEFILRAETPIWKNVLGGCLGTLTVVTEEPAPLVCTPGTWNAFTSCVVHLSLSGPFITIQRLRRLSFYAIPVLRAKTYHSAKSMPCIPKQTLLTDQQPLGLYDDVARLGESEFRNLEWAYMPPGLVKGLPAYEASGSQWENHSFAGSSDSTVCQGILDDFARQLSVDKERPYGTWTSSIRILISSEHRLQPTFCTKLIARFYSVLLRIRISGAYAPIVDCEVPLQVVYPRSTLQGDRSHVEEDAASPCLGKDIILSQHEGLPKYSAA